MSRSSRPPEGVRFRQAHVDDADAILRIYAPYVRETAITFEEVVPSPEDARARIADVAGKYPFLVAESHGRVIAYAKAGPFRSRAAYRWSTETAIYVDRDEQCRGVGTALYTTLLEELEAQGFATALGVVTLPNDASRALHQRCGFRPVGVFERTGYKLASWHDTEWWQRSLRDLGGNPEPTTRPNSDATIRDRTS